MSDIQKHLEGLRKYAVRGEALVHLEAVERWVKKQDAELLAIKRLYVSCQDKRNEYRSAQEEGAVQWAKHAANSDAEVIRLRSALEEAGRKTDELEYALTPFSVKPSDGVDTPRFKRWNKVGGKLIELRAALSHKGEEGETCGARVTCGICQVRYKITKGQRLGGWTCPKCGRVESVNPPSPPLCSTCGGSGEIDCRQCKGTGSWPSFTRQVCKTCFGKTTEPCPTCKGGKETDNG
jgi:hypothetical protein